MIDLSVPGTGSIRIEHLVCDVNGTLAVDGRLIDGVSRAIANLRDRLEVHLLTANTFGQQEIIDLQLSLTAVRLQPGDEAQQKADYVEQLGAERVVAVGQGANDAQMLRAARIGICVLSPEGTSIETMLAANVVAPSILSALEMLEKPLRLVATLRK
jgi:P-type E1-E2 ATPase